MLQAFRRRRRNREIVARLYDGVVDHARQPRFFVEGGLPDTVMGRFDALAIGVFLFLHRCRADPQLAALSQDLVDRFMTDMDHTMREMGIGYMAVPKRMRKLAGLFYQRVNAFRAPLEGDDAAALRSAVRDQKLGGEAPLDDAAIAFWSTYMLDEAKLNATLDTETILAGHWHSGRTG